jgi:hypothetical protein
MKLPPTGKCPKCELVAYRLIAEHISLEVLGGESWHGISYVCPNHACRSIVAVQMDPVALIGDHSKALAKQLAAFETRLEHDMKGIESRLAQRIESRR